MMSGPVGRRGADEVDRVREARRNEVAVSVVAVGRDGEPRVLPVAPIGGARQFAISVVGVGGRVVGGVAAGQVPVRRDLVSTSPSPS